MARMPGQPHSWASSELPDPQCLVGLLLGVPKPLCFGLSLILYCGSFPTSCLSWIYLCYQPLLPENSQARKLVSAKLAKRG